METATGQDDRRHWLGLLAKSAAEDLAALLDGLGKMPAYDWLRRPEIGGVMVRGRSGGTGAPFNLGEMTLTRCSIRLDSGQIGHGHVPGRNSAHALRAALVDALMQTDRADQMRAEVLEPLAREARRRAGLRAARAAETKVDFFTMARGEDP